ncbi:MAG: hypothetical protein ISS95_00990 [Candidatus Aenigmarchaeota archaeon]|nr:hypothetical protein [Candidatus Aenigmarchaeota archaeon]
MGSSSYSRLEKEKKVLIYVDTREFNSEIVNFLSQHPCTINKKMLQIADYLCSDRVAIERKSILFNTPVIIKVDDEIKIITIEEAFKIFKKRRKIKVMGLDINNHNMNWFDVYDVTKHKSNNIYGISFTPQFKKKYKDEKNFDIKLTNGHNVYVFRNKKIKCIPTSELKRGDFLLIIPPQLPNIETELYSSFEDFLNKVQSTSTKGFKIWKKEFKLNSSKTKYKIPQINEAFFFVLGLWTAEGFFDKREIRIAQKDVNRNKIIETYLRKVFGSFRKGCDVYSCGGKLYYHIFSQIFKNKTGSKNKFVPSFVLTSPESFKTAFIRGYLFGDGWINSDKKRRNPQIKATSKSKELIAGLSYLLYSLGIENTIKRYYTSYKGERRKYYEITIKTGSLKKFIEIIGNIPTKEVKIRSSVSTKIPSYAKKIFYGPLFRLNKKELKEFYDIVRDLKYLYTIAISGYLDEFRNVVERYNSKIDFSKKHNIHYSTVRNITNNYSKHPGIFLKIVNIIRKENNMPPIKINLRKLKIILKKIHVTTYLNRRIYRNLIPTEGLIKNLYEKIGKKIGVDSIFLLLNFYEDKIFLKRIKIIEKINGTHEVYDFSVEKSENFVGGMVPILLHNTTNDFISSITDQRIFKQVKELKNNFERPLLIIEGNRIYDRLNPNAVRGVLAALALDFLIPIIWTKDMQETAGMIYWIARREQLDLQRTISVRGTKKASTIKGQQEFLIAGLPGISTVRARKMLKHFKTPAKVFSAKEEELAEVEKLGKKTAKEIRKILEKEYG